MGNVASLIAAPVTAPSGLWVIILNWIESGIVNYGWTIILFTLLIKFAMSPLDLLIKYSTKKSTLVQQKLAPQSARLQKKYANNQQAYQMQMNALYKKEGYNMVGSCVIMLVNLALTMTVFLTIFSSLREVSAYKTICQYNNIQTVYEQSMTTELTTTTGFVFDDENTLSVFLAKEDKTPEQIAAIETANNNAKTAVLEVWDSAKEEWLWIKNIWVADGAQSAMPTYEDLKTIASSSKVDEYISYVDGLDQTIYANISGIVGSSETSWNGYYILAVLSAVVTFLSQYVAQSSTKLKNKELNKVADAQTQNAGMMKFMKILMPAMMVIFVLTSSSAFGMYVVTSSLVSMGLSLLISVFVNLMTKKKEAEVTAYLEKEALRLAKRQNKGNKGE